MTSPPHSQNPPTHTEAVISVAINQTEMMNPQPTDGSWLERQTAAIAPYIPDWDISECWTWPEWPEREAEFPDATGQDIGIDCIAVRRSDERYIAIQCKSRQLDEYGAGAAVNKGELDKFVAATSGNLWAERWLVTNGDVPIAGPAMQMIHVTGKPVKHVNIHADLVAAKPPHADAQCPHCLYPDDETQQQTRSCMQNEAVATAKSLLLRHEQNESGGIPKGQARGKIILPCGTGKTRIALRLVQELTPAGDTSIVLCPSIALVAQIRREFLQHATADIRALAVCSDETVGNSVPEDRQNLANDPTLDTSNASADIVKGQVTTDAGEIAHWIRDERGNDRLNVIFGTYQSSHRIADALIASNTEAAVMIADEAHRTAGLRRVNKDESNDKVRDFTVCHDNERFRAKFRIYQTATPRVYDTTNQPGNRNPNWIVRNMDDETTFGVELYRREYRDAVDNGWLSDYRIIALGVNDPDTYKAANELVKLYGGRGRNQLHTDHFLKGMTLALVMAGATNSPDDEEQAPVQSCIGFMNTVAKSKEMATQLQSDTVRRWLTRWMAENRNGQQPAEFRLEHLDASSNALKREDAKRRLAQASERYPHGILNVGIFGEGTDAPSLSAVAFLEPRKSPVDVIQAVGRAMRTSPGKEMGYIVCPIVIPADADAETWLATSSKEEGWQELGQILLALRAHDSRIEDRLADLLKVYVPPAPTEETTAIAIADDRKKNIQYYVHVGDPKEVPEIVEAVLDDQQRPLDRLKPMRWAEQYAQPRLPQPKPADPNQGTLLLPPPRPVTVTTVAITDSDPNAPAVAPPEPSSLVTGKRHVDGSKELRRDSPARQKRNSASSEGLQPIDYQATKKKAAGMINNGTGVKMPNAEQRRKQQERRRNPGDKHAQLMLNMIGLDDQNRNAITANLLSKSGLTSNRVDRDLNLLEYGVGEASRCLREDHLKATLDAHFGLDNLDSESRKKQADGCTIGALLMMNAAMLHQRIAAGQWLTGISDLSQLKNDENIIRRVDREWGRIMRHDFLPVLEPALEAIYATENTGKTAGLTHALHIVCAEAERIAYAYADMGADHAGPLFNKVMGNQTSDGAFFTRPAAASLAARLTLDLCNDRDWRDPDVWREHKTVDIACGSGTMLAATITDMKRRARESGASAEETAALQKIAVEETIKGLDINPVSLQLAAAQLTAGNLEIRYQQMGLHHMPYGPQENGRMTAGTLELLAQRSIIPRSNELDIADDDLASRNVQITNDSDAKTEKAVSDIADTKIVIMNPPFTSWNKMGEKFPKETQQALRQRTSTLEGMASGVDENLKMIASRTTVRPLFVMLSARIANKDTGIVTMINPTIALSAPSGLNERLALAREFHIHTVLTCHQPENINLAQQAGINTSMIIMQRHRGERPHTRFINLDRLPANESEVQELHRCITENGGNDLLPDGWGESTMWPAERIASGDWSAAIWRSPELAEAAHRFSNDTNMPQLKAAGRSSQATGRLLRGSYERASDDSPVSFPVVKSAGASAQRTIESHPDENWAPKNGKKDRSDAMLAKAGHLLITASQNSGSARLASVAADEKYVGNSWMPVAGLEPAEAKALAVAINSTAGRLQLMNKAGETLTYPTYSTTEADNLRIPDVKDDRIRGILAACWERTKGMTVPQYRDGECEVRRLWDEAVADAMGWDASELTRLRLLLHQEPHVRGLGYGQYAANEESE